MKPPLATPWRDAPNLARGLAGGSLAAAATTALLITTNLDNAPQWPAFLEIIPLIAAYAIAGALIARRQPRNAIGWVFLLISTDTGLTALADAYAGHHLPGWAAAAWFQTWNYYLCYPVGFSVLLMLFPNGRLPSRRWRPLLGLAVLAAAFRVFIELLGSVPITGHFSGSALLAANPTGIVPVSFENSPAGVALYAASWFLSLLVLAGATLALLTRLFRSRAEERQQLKWLAIVSGLVVPAFASHFLIQVIWGSSVFDYGALVFHPLLVLGLPVATAIAILKYRLYEIDVLINRALVYGALTIVVVGFYVGVVGFLGMLLQQRASLLISLLATGVIALAFAPLRMRVQGAVNRLLFGARPDPYEVLAGLGRQLEATSADTPLLEAVAGTVARALRLPFVALRVPADGRDAIHAEYGSMVGEPIVIPLLYQGEPTGDLVLSFGSHSAHLSPGDQRLLADLTRQAAAAAHSVVITAQLQRSRERLVSALEEERRRMRRDLHDGLGPALAAQTLKAGSARALFTRDPERAQALLEELEADAQTAMADVRRLVYNLRPPALDELGLAGAIRQTAATHAGGMRMTVELPDELPPLPAAVELAAYRITQEALTNVTRHARAGRCRLRLTVDEDLELEVIDNGIGLGNAGPPGVGMSSIRERAAELGGTSSIGPGRPNGTRVFVQLPILARA
ncbi:MAG TPA: GAF domain-containing sensor histidine kinase [Candidatus Dormibacteraeota bacterium]|nr:GAF domain-containing sensor histidine kinase [Candidatus Dormibacteraeota bacterium]